MTLHYGVSPRFRTACGFFRVPLTPDRHKVTCWSCRQTLRYKVAYFNSEETVR